MNPFPAVVGSRFIAVGFLFYMLLYLRHNLSRGLWPVHRIDMDAVYAMCFQILDLADGILDACFAHVFFVFSMIGD